MRLTRDELLLLDWVLHVPMPSAIDGDMLDWHMKWHPVRDAAWGVLREINPGELVPEPPPTYDLGIELDDGEAKALLALLPTTFRWGNGADCGYSLKAKLWSYLHHVEEAEHGNEGQTPGNPANKTDPTP